VTVVSGEEEIGATCCFAIQDKVWVTGPGGERWEAYTALANSETFFAPAEVGRRATHRLLLRVVF